MEGDLRKQGLPVGQPGPLSGRLFINQFQMAPGKGDILKLKFDHDIIDLIMVVVTAEAAQVEPQGQNLGQ